MLVVIRLGVSARVKVDFELSPCHILLLKAHVSQNNCVKFVACKMSTDIEEIVTLSFGFRGCSKKPITENGPKTGRETNAVAPFAEHLSERTEMKAASTTRGLTLVSPNAFYCPLKASYRNQMSVKIF